MKIRPMGAELFHADRQTDMTKIIVCFRSFADAPKTLKLAYFIHKTLNKLTLCINILYKNLDFLPGPCKKNQHAKQNELF